ncbi:THAP domain-containing protein 1-like [Hermetia illucens]|uniref:THAP domain-containing protein 1-like n=1 Tax=Hermetia illucens TaxID=343691 RepID=UPI0018CC1315|nr:THAP domain-containing protein 1-like [Hermetia illucens]
MVRCAINGCESYQGKKGSTLRFFRFPKNKTICEEWRKLCEKSRKIDFKNARVCSKHFLQDDYKLQDILLETLESKRRLKDDAVPSQYLREQGTESERSKRVKVRRQKKVVQDAVSSFERQEEIASQIEVESILPVQSTQKDAEVQTEVDYDCSRELQILELQRENRQLKAHNKKMVKRLQRAERTISSLLLELDT